MPTGLPPSTGRMIQSIQEGIKTAIDYFEIPQASLVKDQFQLAVNDVTRACQSSFTFVSTTTKPLVILIALISRYLFAVLKVLAEHTIYHGVHAMKEVLSQLKFAISWFAAYQASLSNAAILMELCLILALILLYMLRKYIERKQYVRRMQLWYELKKVRATRKYYDLVDTIADTSMFMALLLPHIIYIFVVGICKVMLPSVYGYFANKTILADALSFYYPFIKTIQVVHQWKSIDPSNDEKNNNVEKVTSKVKTDDDQVSSYGGILSFLSRKSTSKSKETDPSKSVQPPSKVTRTRLSENDKKVMEEASRLLQYWVVYGVLYAFVETCTLLPIVGRILSNLGGDTKRVSTIWRRSRSSWLDRFKPSASFYNEIKLAFFIWLQLLPTAQREGIDKSPSKISPKRRSKVAFSNHPIDIVYSRFSPFVISFVSSSTSFIHGTRKDSSSSTVESNPPFILRAIEWCRSFLDVMIWTKLISEKTKHRIIATLVELSDLLPAAITLFMPGYFTSYGVIYVQYVVPCAVSAHCYNRFHSIKSNTDTVKVMSLISRYLQYWVLQCIVDWIISSFTPVLSWIPFSTHLTWIVWAYLQLEGISNRFYDVIEWDLVAFGLLPKHSKHGSVEVDMNNTSTMKVLNAITKLASPTPKSKPSKARTNHATIKSCKEESENREGSGDKKSNLSTKICTDEEKEYNVALNKHELLVENKGESDSDYVCISDEDGETKFKRE